MAVNESGNYTNPSLRARIVEQVKAGTSGGAAGEWSFRKSQIVAKKYKEAGGGYKGTKKPPQTSLSKGYYDKKTKQDKVSKKVQYTKPESGKKPVVAKDEKSKAYKT